MSLDAAVHHRAGSPANSDRSSTGNRHPVRDLDEPQRNDKGYRRYATAIDKVLATFDTAEQEWADYIAFLSRLLKAIEAHPPDCQTVPHGDRVGKCLAQCLNPNLPSGVHQKTLEVYARVFAILQNHGLVRTMQIYLAGLAPVMSFASLTVRPPLLTLFEKYFLPLDADTLRPAFRALLLALLPGLEDESAEDYDRTLTLLDQLRTKFDAKHHSGSASDSFFWQCLFLSSTASPSRRPGALNYLVRRMPTLSHSMQNAAQISVPPRDASKHSRTASVVVSPLLYPEPGLLMRCFASGLTDPNPLVQRGFLDLLVSHLPVDSDFLQSPDNAKHLDVLVNAAINVVVRRDMSLNRRLWAWLLGPEASEEDSAANTALSPTAASASEHYLSFFRTFPSASVQRCLLKLFSHDASNPAARARPFRIALSMMDRWEIGSEIVPHIFLPALRNVYQYSSKASPVQVEEVLRSANIFFDGIESYLIWAQLYEVILSTMKSDGSGNPPEQTRSTLELVDFVLSNFNVREEEMLAVHIPLVLMALTSHIKVTFVDGPNTLSVGKTATLQQVFHILERLLQIIPQRGFQSSPTNEDLPLPLSDKVTDIPKMVFDFYTRSTKLRQRPSRPLSPQQCGSTLLSNLYHLTAWSLDQKLDALLEICSHMIGILLSKLHNAESALQSPLARALKSVIHGSEAEQKDAMPFPRLLFVSNILASIGSQKITIPAAAESLVTIIVKSLINRLWPHLSPQEPQHHVEVVRTILLLDSAYSEYRLVESFITTLLTPTVAYEAEEDNAAAIKLRSQDDNLEPLRHFTVFLTHTYHLQSTSRRDASRKQLSASRPTFLDPRAIPLSNFSRPLRIMLDQLATKETPNYELVRGWLQLSPVLSSVFEILTDDLASANLYKALQDTKENGEYPFEKLSEADIQWYAYLIQHLVDLLQLESDNVWNLLSRASAPKDSEKQDSDDTVLLLFYATLSVDILEALNKAETQSPLEAVYKLRLLCARALTCLLRSPDVARLKDLALDIKLIRLMHTSLKSKDEPMQFTLLNITSTVLGIRTSPENKSNAVTKSRDNTTATPSEKSPTNGEDQPQPTPIPPAGLLNCIREAITCASNAACLERWVSFYAQVFDFYPKLLEGESLSLAELLCTQLIQVFDDLKTTYATANVKGQSPSEAVIIQLLNALDLTLTRTHMALAAEEQRLSALKSPDHPQGFFGNMVSGVFSGEAGATPRVIANDRAGILYSIQQAVQLSLDLWSWAGVGSESANQDTLSVASYSYAAVRIRNRTRRFLEHLLAMETLETLETLAIAWRKAETRVAATSVFGLLHVLQGARPLHIIPAILNAIYSRTNPDALEKARRSSLTVDLTDVDLVAFLIEYTVTLEDDALDEMWTDCMTLLRDVLGNPLPHRQILPNLLEFTIILAKKLENTNFGDQRKMRKELSDFFMRLLAATLTTRSLSQLQEQASIKMRYEDGNSKPRTVLAILDALLPQLSLLLDSGDRISTATANISSNVFAPAQKAKVFPSNVTMDMLNLMAHMGKLTGATKVWKRDVGEYFNDPRFFSFSIEEVSKGWIPILRQTTSTEKDLFNDQLSKLYAPTTAGIVFGVGAASARLEADRKTQMTLRRLALLLTVNENDALITKLPALFEKISELLHASPTSSPSIATRAEVFMLLRAIVLRTSTTQLAPVWPMLNAELQRALHSLSEDSEAWEVYNAPSTLQACKLLDFLALACPDDFQLLEWIYITDTVDAVYRPEPFHTSALTDLMAEKLAGQTQGDGTSHAPLVPVRTHDSVDIDMDEKDQRHVSLSLPAELDVKALSKRELIDVHLRPWLGHLSIAAFEGTYSLLPLDLDECERELVRDLCDARTIV